MASEYVRSPHGRQHEGEATRAAAIEFGLVQGGRRRPAFPPGVDRGGQLGRDAAHRQGGCKEEALQLAVRRQRVQTRLGHRKMRGGFERVFIE
jgi:hypothetical protein